MGRGLSKRQRRILKLASLVQRLHGQPTGRGRDKQWPEYVVRVDIGCIDVNNPLCVHLIEGVPYVKKIDCGWHEQANFGNFEARRPEVHVAKVGIAKALTRLVQRGLLQRGSVYGGWCMGYVLTPEGEEIAKDVEWSLPRRVIERGIRGLHSPFWCDYHQPSREFGLPPKATKQSKEPAA